MHEFPVVAKPLDIVNELKNNDVVIGPTFDGGYYLIGMNTHHNELFQQIKWSTDSVYQETLKHIKNYPLKKERQLLKK
mgnify:CR=1 FL=1